MATGKFVMKGQVAQDLLVTLAGTSLYRTQLFELLGRTSNCNYKMQIIQGLGAGEPLEQKIRTSVRNNAGDATALPAATRFSLNALAAQAGGATAAYPASGPITIDGLAANLVTAHGTKPRKQTLAANVFTLTGSSATYSIKVRVHVGLFNGAIPLGAGHPAPVFVSPDEALHDVAVLVELERSTNGTVWTVLGSSAVTLRHDTIVGKTTMVAQIHAIDTAGAGTKYRLKLTRGPKVCTFGGVDDRIGFIKQASPGANAKDTSNFIDFVEIA